MRLLILGLSAVVVAACAGGETSTTPEDDGSVITGAGGGATSSSAASTSTGATTSASTGATTTTTGAGGAGGNPPACPDLGVGEPNETENDAFPLKGSAISDCDGDGGTVTGTIAGMSDVDWFTYEGDDGIGCVVDPTRSFTQSGSGLRLCKFMECKSGDTEFGCPSGTTGSTSPGGRAGCCGSSGFDVTDLNCTGTSDEHVDVYIRIDKPGANATTCDDYSLGYHY